MKIISGGQTGADQGALVGARRVGLETGGWMPRGFLTEAGPCPALADVYGMQEHRSREYPPRTRQNVKDSDGTIWIDDGRWQPDSRGKRATVRACEDYGKPFLCNPDAAMLRWWVASSRIKVLNVAGPRGSRDPGAHARAADLIAEAFGEPCSTL